MSETRRHMCLDIAGISGRTHTRECAHSRTVAGRTVIDGSCTCDRLALQYNTCDYAHFRATQIPLIRSLTRPQHPARQYLYRSEDNSISLRGNLRRDRRKFYSRARSEPSRIQPSVGWILSLLSDKCTVIRRLSIIYPLLQHVRYVIGSCIIYLSIYR